MSSNNSNRYNLDLVLDGYRNPVILAELIFMLVFLALFVLVVINDPFNLNLIWMFIVIAILLTHIIMRAINLSSNNYVVRSIAEMRIKEIALKTYGINLLENSVIRKNKSFALTPKILKAERNEKEILITLAQSEGNLVIFKNGLEQT